MSKVVASNISKKSYLAMMGKLSFAPRGRALAQQLLLDGALFVAVIAILQIRSGWGNLAVQPLLACLYFRSFSMMHDAVHGSVSKSNLVNDCLGIIYGGICFLPFTTWRSMHLEHHSWVGNFSKDPVMKMVRNFPAKSEAHQKFDSLLWRSWIPYIAFLQEAVFWTLSARFVIEPGKYAGKRLELFASIAATVVVAAAVFGAGAHFAHWALLVPSIVIYLGMVEIFNLPHHLSMPRLEGESKLSLWEQYKVSRTCLYSGWFSRLILLNFNYHAEHHMFPTLPWYELPKAYQLVSANRPDGYNLCQGHEWIMDNRRKELAKVFAPTRILDPEAERAREAA